MRDKPSLTIPDHARKQATVSIRQYFADELGQEIGDLKASLVLDYFLVELGPAVYNKAIADAKTFYSKTLGLRLVEDDQFALVFDGAGVPLRIQKVDAVHPHPFTALGWPVAHQGTALTELGPPWTSNAGRWESSSPPPRRSL